MHRIARSLLRLRIPIVIGILACSAWPVHWISRLHVDNSIDVWIDHGRPSYQAYRQFLEKYGSDEWIWVGVECPENPGAAMRRRLAELACDLELEPGIERVWLPGIMVPGEGLLSEGLRNLLWSPEQRAVGVLIQPTVEENRAHLAAWIRTIKKHFGRDEFHLGGPMVLNRALDELSQSESGRLIPLAVVVAGAILLGLYRGVWKPAIAGAAAIMAVVWAVGLMAWAGKSLNMVALILPILLGVLAIAGAIHVMEYLGRIRIRSLHHPDCLTDLWRRVGLPLGVANLTTAAGFLSLTTSHLQPVGDFGLFAAVGILVSLVLNLTFVPAASFLFPQAGSGGQGKASFGVFGSLLAGAAVRHRSVLLTLAVLMMAGSGFLVFHLQVSSNVLHFFRPESRIVRDYRWIESRFAGLSTLQVVAAVPPGERDRFIQQLRMALGELPATPLLVDADSRGVHLTLFVRVMESLAFNRMVSGVRSAVDDVLPDGAAATVTGSVALLNSMQEELIRTQVVSFSAALGMVSLILALVLREWKATLGGILVNLFPLLVVFGAMAALHIPLNSATIIVASVAIGIVVDDTVFALVRLKAVARTGLDLETAIRKAFGEVATPVWRTTAITTAGFLVLTVSKFKPIALFGGLGAAAMLAALMGDLVFLPAYLTAVRPQFQSSLVASKECPT